MSRASPGPSNLVADVGGTKIRIGLAREKRLERTVSWSCADYASIDDALRHYLDSEAPGVEPPQAVIAVAGPVSDDRVELTNQDWSFSIAQLREDLDLDTLQIVNDFEALAAATPYFDATDASQLKKGTAEDAAPVAILGAGTGLGVAALLPGVNGWIPIATEGGHRDLAAANEREWAVVRALQKCFGRVSCERVLSGPGLTNLYLAICELESRQPDEASPAEIVERATESKSVIDLEVVRLFSGWLGSFAGDLTLTLGARGGVYLGGGVVPKMGDAFDIEVFTTRFLDKGRFRSYLDPIPIWLVHNRQAALIGAAALLGKHPSIY